jgi:hypothetical protein
MEVCRHSFPESEVTTHEIWNTVTVWPTEVMNVGLARLAATGNALEASRLELRTLHARSIDHQKR